MLGRAAAVPVGDASPFGRFEVQGQVFGSAGAGVRVRLDLSSSAGRQVCLCDAAMLEGSSAPNRCTVVGSAIQPRCGLPAPGDLLRCSKGYTLGLGQRTGASPI